MYSKTYSLSMADVHAEALQAQLDAVKAVVSLYTDCGGSAQVFGQSLKALAASTNSGSAALWSATNTGMMGFPLETLIDPEFEGIFHYRAPHAGLKVSDAGEMYLPQLDGLPCIILADYTPPPPGVRITAVRFHRDPLIGSWTARLYISSRPKSAPRTRRRF
jgi:hypothetical protein